MTPRYSSLQIALHWLSALLILVVVSLPYARDTLAAPMGGIGNVLTLHKSLGFAILMMTLLRLAVRGWLGAPENLTDAPSWQRLAARTGHWLLYALLLLMPLSGLLAGKRPFDLFWLVTITPFDLPEALRNLASGFHRTAPYLLFALVLGHAAAALWHHHVRKDLVLRAMLPSREI